MNEDPKTQDHWLRTDGERIVRADGTPVRLRGVGLGGWMNMENFITGFPGTETQQRQALRRVWGDDVYQAFFAGFLEEFFTDADAAFCASIGLNLVRLPVNYRHFEDDAHPFDIRDDGFAALDRAIDICARHGIYTVVDLHALPGFQNQDWHSDNPTHHAFFWDHRHFQDRVLHLWEVIADRYRDNPAVAGYNPINEPGDVEGRAVGPYYQRLTSAIRAVDSRHILFLDGNRYSTDFSAFGEPAPHSRGNVVYTAHDYTLPGFIDGGDYPGTSRGTYVDREVVARTFAERTAFMRQTGTPIWIGEFGPVYTGDPRADEMRLRLLADQLEIYAEHDAHWSIWTYKDVGTQGLVTVAPDSPWLRRIQPVLDKKARLGVDAWGTRGDGIADVLTPLQVLLAREFPDFDPFPFGRAWWVERLVRHILLAEPMVADFARCLADLPLEQVSELTGSFRFESCAIRTPVVELLRTACNDTA